MVVTGIFMILSAVVLSANTRFGNLIVLQNLAHDMALTIREAQIYGIAVRRYESANFEVAYGMYFVLPPAGSPSTYELFADPNDNGVYDPGETVTSTTIGGGYRITDICARNSSGIEECGLSEIHVLFQRPEPDALIRRAEGSPLEERARIVIESPRGDQAGVIVEASGQISVQ